MATPTFVQGVGSLANLGGASTASLAFTSQNTSVSNLLVALIQVFHQTAVLTNVTDNQGAGNVWNIAAGQAIPGGNYDIYFAYALNTIGGSKPTVTAHFSTSTNNVAMALGEYSGVNTFRATDAGNTGSGTTPTSAPVTAVTGDLLIGYFGGAGQITGTITPGSGYNLRNQGTIGGAGTYFNAFEDKVAAANGSATAGFTISNEGWAAGILAFYQGASGGSGKTWVQKHRDFANKRGLSRR